MSGENIENNSLLNKMHTYKYSQSWNERAYGGRNCLLDKNITCYWKHMAWVSFRTGTKKSQPNKNHMPSQVPRGTKI